MGSSPTKRQLACASTVLFVVAPGWVLFGVVFGPPQDNMLAFVLSLAMGACNLALADYARRRAANMPSGEMP